MRSMGAPPTPASAAPETPSTTPAADNATPSSVAWRAAQYAAWLCGAGIFAAVVLTPHAGLHALWNVLIPAAPALFAFVPGVWRNICPLGATALAARRLRGPGAHRLSPAAQAYLQLLGVAALLLIVPLRHVALDVSGAATALALAAMAAAAALVGACFDGKSGWCAGLCPVHPVERLYGTRPALTVRNAHCQTCGHCVVPCPDSTRYADAQGHGAPTAAHLARTILIGSFAGFVWGWFHVPNARGPVGIDAPAFAFAYAMPLGCGTVSMGAYLVLRHLTPERHRTRLARTFAAAAIACYYWYRLPALFGFGMFPGDGMLVDLHTMLPAWFPLVSRCMTTLLFFWWIAGRRDTGPTWALRPPILRRTLAGTTVCAPAALVGVSR